MVTTGDVKSQEMLNRGKKLGKIREEMENGGKSKHLIFCNNKINTTSRNGRRNTLKNW
jgi:hypothetical protein